MNITVILIAVTVLISFVGFSNGKLIDDLIFYPPAIADKNQWYRFITCGFIHADTGHLLFNMLSFYIFGKNVEMAFRALFQERGSMLYLVMYITALAACLLPTYFKQKNNYNYRSLGASGAVSAVIFAFIFLAPTQGLGLMFIPVYIPGFIFGPLYLIISSVLANRGGSHINHSAHFWGAVYGVAFLAVMSYALSDYDLIRSFVQQVRDYEYHF
jgi:membrane associated rhomboid family serine protease